ncbi:MAG: GNAT family N-acetyltransferase, partial [Lachnospiraceae bacterium]|nr:GNAT family N-acetyltransferase [Lachnospiraceae bacterium]
MLKAIYLTDDAVLDKDTYEAFPFVIDFLQRVKPFVSLHLVNFFIKKEDIIKSNPLLFSIFDTVDNTIDDKHTDYNDMVLITSSFDLGINNDISTIAYDNNGNSFISGFSMVIESYCDIDYEFINTYYLHSKNLPVTIDSTERLILRELTVSDVVKLHELYNDYDNKRFIQDISDVDTEVQKHIAYIHNIYHMFGYGYWGIFLKDSDILIGKCGFKNTEINGEVYADLGYMLSNEYRHKGYAFEACTAAIRYMKENYSDIKLCCVINCYRKIFLV